MNRSEMLKAVLTGAGSHNPYAAAEAQGQNEKLKMYLAGEAQKQKHAQDFEDLQKLKDMGLANPGGAISAGDIKVGIAPREANTEAQQARQDAETRKETENLTNMIMKTSKGDIDKLRANQVAMEILKDPNISNTTILREALAREMVGGRVPIQLVDTVLGPQSLKEKVLGTVGGLAGHPEINPYTEAQRANHIKLLQQLSAAPLGNVQRNLDAVRANAQQHAPFLSRTGQLESVLGNIGSQIEGYYPQKINDQPPAESQVGNVIKKAFGMGQPKPQLQSLQQLAPQQPKAPVPPMSGQTGTIRVKHKASGQTGTLPASEFDPNQYEQL